MSDFMHDYPTRRIQPRDGMAINADVWLEAHDYHRLRDQHHTLLAGHGILHGLAVVQTKIASAAVWILPGFAVDGDGRTIVLKAPHKCDVGSTRGTVYLYLTASEHPTGDDGRSAPADEAAKEEKNETVHLRYMQEDVNIIASALLPRAGEAFVELARIQRSDLVAVQDAIHPRRPGNNEIDLRYRREVLPRVLPSINAGVVHLGAPDAGVWDGLDALAQSAAFAQQCRLVIADDVPVNAISAAFDLLFLHVKAPFKLEPALVAALRAWLDARKVLFVDGSGDAAQVSALFDALGVSLAPLPPAHTLLTQPHRFAQWPEGAALGGIRVATQPACRVIASDMDMSALWRGVVQGKPASREAIRAAHEWGVNVLDYVLHAQHAGAAESEAGHV